MLAILVPNILWLYSPCQIARSPSYRQNASTQYCKWQQKPYRGVLFQREAASPLVGVLHQKAKRTPKTAIAERVPQSLPAQILTFDSGPAGIPANLQGPF